MHKYLSNSKIYMMIEDKQLNKIDNLIQFLNKNKNRYNFYDLSKIAELSNQQRSENSAYYTDSELLDYIYDDLPEFSNKQSIEIIEPSIGVGNFLPILFKKYKNKQVNLTVIDIDKDSIRILKTLLKIIGIPRNFHIKYVCNDFLLSKISHVDLIIGNPPFSKVSYPYLSKLNKKEFYNNASHNLASYFIEKSIKHSDNVCMIMPKNVLNTPEFNATREFISGFKVKTIIDFGEYGFPGVLIETISLNIDTVSKSLKTKVISLANKISMIQNQNYIFDKKLPYWVIYRNKFFDEFYNSLVFDIFDVFRDRQITNSLTNSKKGGIRVLKSRNISDDGSKINDIEDYDAYVPTKVAKNLEVYKYINADNIYLAPNMTYNIRVMKKPKGIITNGSVAILIPKQKVKLTPKDLAYFSSKKYRDFMKIARNHQTRTLNIDTTSVYFYGRRKHELFN